MQKHGFAEADGEAILSAMNAMLLASEMPAHPDDPTLQSEHMAAMDLAKPEEATHVATASGDWSSASTWQGGRIPDQGSRVLIPEAHSVTLDRELASELEWLRLNGELRFATDRDTELRVDTLVTAPGSRLEIGTAEQPVQSNVQARIVFADRGPLTVENDPLLMGRGAILHGTTRIHGAAKTSAVTAAIDPKRGDREIVLTDQPSGWSVGDQLVIAGTRPDGGGDETVVIQSIEGSRILLEAPLTEDHLTPRDHLKVHVANLSRNVEFTSENTAIDRRGHVMFMHTRDVDVANAAFNDLGRTDKLRPLDSPYFDDEGFFVEETGSNTGGRYSVHFHRNGVERSGSPAVIRGSVVAGNPGWGFVNHSSYVDFIDNVAFDVVGAAFSTEAGDEIGRFQDNLAIRMHGTGDEPISRQEDGDFGHAGDGFWLQGPGVVVENNVAAGATGSGLILYAEPLFEDGLGITTFPSGNLPDPFVAEGDASVPVSLAPLARFSDNESYGSALGAQIYYHRTFITIEEEQEEQARFQFAPSVMDGMSLWSNSNGMQVNYTVDTDFRDFEIIGPADGSGDTGFDAASNFYNRGTHHYENFVIEDYEIGFSAPRSGVIHVRNGYFNNITDFYLNEPRQLGRRMRFEGDIQFGDRASGVVEGEVVPRSYFEMDPELAPAADSANEHFLLDDQVILDFGPFQDQQLYFYEQLADHVLFPEPPQQLTPDDPGPTIGDEFVGVTNAEIASVLGESFGGAMVPDDAREVDRILGLVGSPAADLPELNPNPLPLDDEEEDDLDEDEEEGEEELEEDEEEIEEEEDDLEEDEEGIEEDVDEIDDPIDEPEGSELEIGLSEQGGNLRLRLRSDELIERSDDVVRTPVEGFDAISLFSSNFSEKVKFKFDPRLASSPDVVNLFAARGGDRIQIVQKNQGGPDLLAIHGQQGRDRLDASKFAGEVELDGGPGRDVLIGGRSRSELWGGSGADTFDLSRESSGVQWIMDFDPDVDRLRLGQSVGAYEINARGDDLWLLNGERVVAVFDGFVDQQDTLELLIS